MYVYIYIHFHTSTCISAYTKDAKKAVDDALALASGKVGDAETYNTACKMEPRLWMTPWKSQFVEETAGHLKVIRLVDNFF